MAHRIAPRVEIDLDDIWLYVAKESGNTDTANHLIDTVAAAFLSSAIFGTSSVRGRRNSAPGIEA